LPARRGGRSERKEAAGSHVAAGHQWWEVQRKRVAPYPLNGQGG
jgi:hypothetical protein